MHGQQNVKICLIIFHVQLEDGHYQAPKHVAVHYVENTLYSANKFSCVRPIHTLYIAGDVVLRTQNALHNILMFWSRFEQHPV